MPELTRMCSDVRMLLGNPLPQHPNPRQVLYAVSAAAQALINQLQNGMRSWSVQEYTLTTASGQQDYIIGRTDWGKPLLVVTTDVTNPAHVERVVEFSELGNIDAEWMARNDVAQGWTNWDGSSNSAVRFAFYHGGSGQYNYKVRIKPIPQSSATYSILYETGSDWAFTSAITTIPLLTEHAPLIVYRAALNALPNALWWDTEAKAKLNMEKAQMHAGVMQGEMARLQREFDIASRSMVQPHSTFVGMAVPID